MSDTGLKSDKEGKWELVQIKAFTAWINGYLTKQGLRVENLLTDLKDGVKLNYFLEEACNKALKRWNKRPAMRVHMLENVSIALDFVQKDLGVRLVGIGSEDLVDGQHKLTLGLLWSLFRRLRIETISEEGQSSEDGLLAWIRKMTEGYDNVKITNFKDSFNDGMAFSALIHKFNPDLIDFDSLDPANREANLIAAFDIAEHRLGIPRLLDPEDLLNGNPDERSVILYSSLFFHAFVADEERRKQQGNEKVIVSKLSAVEQSLQEQRELNDELLQKNKLLEEQQALLHARLEQQKAEMEAGLEEKARSIKAMEDNMKKLLEEIAYWRDRCAKELEMRGLLEEKVSVLEGLLEQNLERSKRSEEERNRIRAELEELRSRGELLGSDLSMLEEERSKLLTDAEEKARRLQELDEKRSKLLEELASLRARIQAEIDRRKEKEAEVLRLRNELELQKKRQIVQTKARVGLDVLRYNLEQHLEDLYRWRELNDSIFKDSVEEFDLGRVLSDISGKSFEDQLNYLDAKLQEENRSLSKILKLQEVNASLRDVVIKSGFLVMKGRKEWKKRWFVLSTNKLSYYEDEGSDEVSGSIAFDETCEVVRQKAIKEDESNPASKKVWPLKVSVGERKLFIRAATKKERHAWFLALTSRIAAVSYLASTEAASVRPDTRVLAFFHSDKSPSLILNDKALDSHAVSALVKGLPGRDELEELSLQNAGLTVANLEQLVTVIDKLVALKSINLSGNKLGPSAIPHITKLFSNPTLSVVSLANNDLDTASIEALLAALNDKENLTILDVSNNNLGSSGVAAFTNALAANKSKITSLPLSGNAISDDGVSAIADLIRANTPITHIDLSNNKIGDAGAALLADALKSNTHVTELNLSNNNLQAKGLSALQAVFGPNKELNVVLLSGNSALETDSDLVSFAGLKLPQLTLSRY